MDKNEALETLINYANSFANSSLWGRDAQAVLKDVADAAEVLRTELAANDTSGSYEI